MPDNNRVEREFWETTASMDLDAFRRAFEQVEGATMTSGTSWATLGTTTIPDMVDSENKYYIEMDERNKEYKPDDEITLRDGTKAKFKDCVLINDRYYLSTDSDVAEDYFEKGRYCLKSMASCLVSKFKEDGTMDINNLSYYFRGYKRDSQNYIVEVHDGNTHQLADYNKIPKDFYVESLRDNVFYHKNIAKSNAITEKSLKIKGRKATNIHKPSWDRSDLKKDYEMGVISPSFVKTEGKRYSFGLELETISGMLPVYVDNYLNYLSIRDGSLKDDDGNEYGLEYVTGVLMGDTGLLQTKRLCNELTKRCIVNKKCG